MRDALLRLRPPSLPFLFLVPSCPPSTHEHGEDVAVERTGHDHRDRGGVVQAGRHTPSPPPCPVLAFSPLTLPCYPCSPCSLARRSPPQSPPPAPHSPSTTSCLSTMRMWWFTHFWYPCEVGVGGCERVWAGVDGCGGVWRWFTHFWYACEVHLGGLTVWTPRGAWGLQGTAIWPRSQRATPTPPGALRPSAPPRPLSGLPPAQTTAVPPSTPRGPCGQLSSGRNRLCLVQDG